MHNIYANAVSFYRYYNAYSSQSHRFSIVYHIIALFINPLLHSFAIFLIITSKYAVYINMYRVIEFSKVDFQCL